MKLIEFNWSPTSRQLRQFSILCALLLPLIGWLWGASGSTVGILGGVGLFIAVLGLAIPAAVKPVFILLTLITAPIGLVVGEIAMLLIFFGVFLPIALLFRVLRRDELQRTLDRNAPSYWQEKKQARDVASYFRQS